MARARRAAARRAAGAALAALAAFAALAGPAGARRRGPRSLGVVAAETCTWAPDAGGGTLELSGVRLAQAFSEAPRRGASEAADAAALVAAFVKPKPRRRKNVAVTAWSPGAGDAGAGSPVYLVGALAGAEAGTGGAGGAATLRLRLEQAPAQAQASRPPPAGAGGPTHSCSAFLDPVISGSGTGSLASRMPSGGPPGPRTVRRGSGARFRPSPIDSDD